MSAEDVKELFIERMAGRTQRSFADAIGMSPGKVNDYIRTGLEPTPQILRILELRRVVYYEPISEVERSRSALTEDVE